MALDDDLAIDPSKTSKASAAPSSLDADLGGGTDWSNSDGTVYTRDPGSTPVSDEAINSGLNFLRSIPRHIIQAGGAIASNFGNNSTPDFNINGSEGSGAGALYEGSRRAAGALENNIPALKPVNEGPIERVAGQGFEMGLAGLGGGPEAVVPSIASGVVSQGIKESGGGTLAQTAGALAPFAPAAGAAALRGAVRGGPAGAEAMENSIRQAEQAGLPSSLGSASGNPLVRGYENVASRLPGGKPLQDVRAVNPNVEASVNDIIMTIHPEYDTNPATPSEAGQEIKRGAKETMERNADETSKAKTEMDAAVGGADTPFPVAHNTNRELQSILHPTGIPEVDQAVTSAKTKAAAGVIKKVEREPVAPTGYTVDEGIHSVKSDNGESHARELATGDLQVFRDDTAPEAQGKGEGTGRLELLAHAATAKGKSLVSDMSVSPAEANTFDALGRRGWTVEKNPNAQVNPSTGNLISDSPKNPVYRVTAPKSSGGSKTTQTPSEQNFTGEWTYDPKTGKSEPVTQNKTPEVKTVGEQAELGDKTPWTFDSFRAMRTKIGQQIARSTGAQKTELQRLYGAMSDDLSSFVASKGDDAVHKYEFFNATATNNADQRKALTKAIQDAGGTGDIFNRALSGSSTDGAKIARVVGAMDEQGKNTFRAVVLHRMGRPGGAQTAAFSADTFLNNWNKMAPEAKNALFGEGKSVPLRKSLDNLTEALTDMKAGGRLKSNLGQTISSAIPHGVGPVASTVGGIIAIKELAHPAVQMFGEHPIAGTAALAGVAGASAINPIMSRVLTNPKVINWFAQTTRLPKNAIPAAVNQLRSMGAKDPDAKQLADWIDGKSGGANSTSTQESAPAPGGPGADGSDFTNPGKFSKIKTPAGVINGVDPSTFGSRFNNPRANPRSIPPDLPVQASDFIPAR